MKRRLETIDVPTFSTFEEILKRPKFKQHVDSQIHKLKDVVAPYSFKDSVQCGLKSCHTHHMNGWLVVTTTDVETNIGKDCGRTHFGIEFRKRQSAFSKAADVSSKNSRINDFLNEEDLIRERVHLLWSAPQGGKWVHQSLKEFAIAFPNGLRQQLFRRAIDNENVVYTERRATDREREVAEQLKQKVIEVVSEPVGTLHGLEVFLFDIQTILKNDILGIFKTISESAETLGARQRTALVQAIGDVEPNFDKAENAIRAGRKFFEPNNFRLLPFIFSDERLRQSVANVSWNFEAGMPYKKKK